jgi:cation transport ATPase
MGMSNSDPTDLKIQLEVIRERLKYAEEKSRQQEQMLAQAYKNVGQKEAELQQIRSEREDLKIKWEVLQRDFKHSQNSLLQATQANTKKKRTTQLLGFLASFTFLISSILVNLGTAMLTSLSTSSIGWILIALATAAYLIAVLMTIVFA